ncbi:hypothetical protein SDJN02_01866, partial [Cucurbita argyrosperma subsp. argyrosperma]
MKQEPSTSVPRQWKRRHKKFCSLLRIAAAAEDCCCSSFNPDAFQKLFVILLKVSWKQELPVNFITPKLNTLDPVQLTDQLGNPNVLVTLARRSSFGNTTDHLVVIYLLKLVSKKSPSSSSTTRSSSSSSTSSFFKLLASLAELDASTPEDASSSFLFVPEATMSASSFLLASVVEGNAFEVLSPLPNDVLLLSPFSSVVCCHPDRTIPSGSFSSSNSSLHGVYIYIYDSCHSAFLSQHDLIRNPEIPMFDVDTAAKLLLEILNG